MSVTLKEIAALANVHPSTVSRALNNTGYVHPDTKKRILDAVAELSYSPNVLGQLMRKGKRRTIGVVVPNLSIGIFSEIVQEITQEARTLGFEVLLSVTGDSPKHEKQILDRLRTNMIDGIIIAPTGGNKTVLRDINASGIPVVQMIRDQDKELPCVVGNYYENTISAVKYLGAIGCEKIALLNGPEDVGPFQERLEGYKVGMRGLRQARILPEGDSKKDFYENGLLQCDSLLDSMVPVDGILVVNELQAMGVFRSIKNHGLSVPWDIKLVSLTGHSIAERMETSLSSIELPFAKMGKYVAALIIELAKKEKGKQSKKRVRFAGNLIERESTGL